MSSLTERAARRSVIAQHHADGPCRLGRGARLCIAVGISIAALTAGAPLHVRAGAPSEASRAHGAAAPVLFVLPRLEVEPAEQAKLFWFVVKGGEDVAPDAHILIKGAPAGVSLSNGRAGSDGDWVVPLSELDELAITVPPGISGRLVLDAALVDGGGAVLDEHPVELVVEAVAANGAEAGPPVKPAAAAGPARPGTDAAPRPEAVDAAPPAAPRGPAPALFAPPVVDADAATATRFAVSINHRPEEFPPGTYVRVKGLAGGVTLSAGQANADRGWVVPLWALDELKIRVPPEMSGILDLHIALVGTDGEALAERSVAVHVRPRAAAAASELAAPGKTMVAPPAPARTTRRASHANGDDRPATSAGRRSARPSRSHKPPGAAPDRPGGSEVSETRNAKSGFCLLEWRNYGPKVLWHVGDCGDADGR